MHADDVGPSADLERALEGIRAGLALVSRVAAFVGSPPGVMLERPDQEFAAVRAVGLLEAHAPLPSPKHQAHARARSIALRAALRSARRWYSSRSRHCRRAAS